MSISIMVRRLSFLRIQLFGQSQFIVHSEPGTPVSMIILYSLFKLLFEFWRQICESMFFQEFLFHLPILLDRQKQA